jgi:pyruvate kinase
LTLSWGTEPIHLPEEGNLDDRVNAALEAVRNRGAVTAGELVGVLAGTDVRSRSTNALRIERVPEA